MLVKQEIVKYNKGEREIINLGLLPNFKLLGCQAQLLVTCPNLNCQKQVQAHLNSKGCWLFSFGPLRPILLGYIYSLYMASFSWLYMIRISLIFNFCRTPVHRLPPVFRHFQPVFQYLLYTDCTHLAYYPFLMFQDPKSAHLHLYFGFRLEKHKIEPPWLKMRCKGKGRVQMTQSEGVHAKKTKR